MGRPLVLLALGLAAYAGVAAPLSVRLRRQELLTSARRALVVCCASLAAASLTLWWALFTRDFSVAYVAAHTSHAQRPWYVFSAFWAGMDGSMLLWCLMLSGFAAAFVARSRPSTEPFVPAAIPVLAGSLVFFTAMTAGPTNPFRLLDVVPADGRGLNPLLQSPGMLIHPPVLYAGYTGMLVPFAIAVAALVTRRTGAEWLAAARRAVLVPWLALGAGMTLGGAWAYTELGWGGYWGWDPVENAALLPWLAATAFLHSAVVQERRGMLKVWNVFLVVLAADLAVFGTFLTRSGLLSSVHTFTESPLGRWYFAFLAALTLLGVGLLAWRLPELRTQASLDAVVSKETGFLLNNLVFVGATGAILWGTLLPTITEAFGEERLAVGPPFFNRMMAPVGVLLLALAALGPVLPWRRGTVRAVAGRLALPAAVASGLALAALLGSGRATFAGLVWLAALTAGVAVRELRTASGNARRLGGYVVHIGIGVMVIGFAGSLFRTQTDVVVSPSERFEAGRYTLVYRRLVRASEPGRDVRLAVLDVTSGGRRIATIRPQQNVHLNFEQPQSEIAIRTTPREDLYVILTGTSATSDEAAFRVYVNPLVEFVWAGGAIVVLGGLLSLFTARGARRAHLPTDVRSPEAVVDANA